MIRELRTFWHIGLFVAAFWHPAELSAQPQKSIAESPAELAVAPKSRPECYAAANVLEKTLLLHADQTIKPTPRELSLEIAIWKYLCDRKKLRLEDWHLVPNSGQTVEDRVVTGTFIKILVASTFFDVPGHSEVYLEGLTIRGEVKLDREILRSGLSIRHSVFKDKVKLDYLRSQHDIDFSGSVFHSSLSAKSIRVNGSMYLGLDSLHPDEFSDRPIGETATIPIESLDLYKSSIEGELKIRNVRITNEIIIASARVQKLLRISDSSLPYLDISDSEFGQLEFVHSMLGSLVANEGKAKSALQADGLAISHNAFFDRSEIYAPIHMAGASIKSHLSFRGATLSEVHLTGSKIAGDFMLGVAGVPEAVSTTNDREPMGAENGSRGPAETNEQRAVRAPAVNPIKQQRSRPYTSWLRPRRLFLDYAEIGLIRAGIAAWPESEEVNVSGLKFGGFAMPDPHERVRDLCYNKATISVLGSYGATVEQFWEWLVAGEKVSAQVPRDGMPTCYYERWLERTPRHTPSVYEWLQQTLRKSGNLQQARAIAIMGKNRERHEAFVEGRYPEAIGLILSGLFIGYGYAPWVSGIWAIFFVGLGAIVFSTTRAAKAQASYEDLNISIKPPFNPILYSFDQLLPFIQLRKAHYDRDIVEPWQRRYFYFHRLMGYVLGFFLIAALSGLTK